MDINKIHTLSRRSKYLNQSFDKVIPSLPIAEIRPVDI